MAEVSILPASAIAVPTSSREKSASAFTEKSGPHPTVQVTMQGKQPIVTNAQQIEMDQPEMSSPMARGTEVDSVLPMVNVTMQGKNPVVTSGGPMQRPQQVVRTLPAPRAPQLSAGALALFKMIASKYLDDLVAKVDDPEAVREAELVTAAIAELELVIAPPAPNVARPGRPLGSVPMQRASAPPPVVVTMHGKTPIVQAQSEGPRPIAVASARGAVERPSRIAPRATSPQARSPLPPPSLPADMPDDLREATEKAMGIKKPAPPAADEAVAPAAPTE